MPVGELVSILMGLTYATVAAYLLAFRPLERPAALLAGALLLNAVMWLIPPSETAPALILSRWSVALFTVGAFAVFFATYPSRLRWRSPAGLAAALGIAWFLGSAGMLLSGALLRGPPHSVAHLAFGAPLGGNLVLVTLMLARMPDLREPLGGAGSAARWFYLAPLGFVFMAGGLHAARAAAAAFGLDAYPAFLYTTTHPAVAALRVALLWGIPALIALVAFLRWRWWMPAALLLAGAAIYAVLALPFGGDDATLRVLADAGELFTPAFVLYAQARYAPFRGEPVGLRSGLLVTAVSALLAYLSVFALVLMLVGDVTLAVVAGPILGLAGAAGMAALVLPRTRRMALRRLFVAAGGASAEKLAAGADVLGRYRVVRLLAEGGQGRVYEATDARADGSGRVVLKAVTNEHALREARILRDLDHPNVVRFVEVVEITGFTLLVLEYAEGGDVRGLLTRRGGRLALPEALALADGILAGLAAAHARGVSHRDVKPENVLLDARGTPKLTDFGAARRAGADATLHIGGLGTLAYLAPEQAQGEPGDARSDVYATAVLVHELLTGARPVRTSDDPYLTRRAILSEPAVVALPEDAAHLAPVLERALEKDPVARYANASEMAGALRTARLAAPRS